MEQSCFFNSRNGDRMYKAEDFAEYFASFIGSGVFPDPSSNLQVNEGLDMRVIVRPGKAWINGYFYYNKSDYIFTLDTADGILSRTDRIVVRWSALDRAITLEVKKGSLAVNPVAPGLQRDSDVYELALADITVAGGVVAIVQADIRDTRLDTNLCGIVVGTVREIDTTAFLAQFHAQFTAWFERMQDTLDEDAAANLYNQVAALQARIELLEKTVLPIGGTGSRYTVLFDDLDRVVGYGVWNQELQCLEC